MDWNIILSIISAFIALVAIISLLFELRNSRISLQTGALLQLEERMYSPEMINTRQIAANKLLKGRYTVNQELEIVLDFLSTICALFERGVIDKKLTWEMYSYWIIRYWLCAEEYIIQIRTTDDPISWTHLERLAKIFIKVETSTLLSKEALNVFLLSEANVNLPKPPIPVKRTTNQKADVSAGESA